MAKSWIRTYTELDCLGKDPLLYDSISSDDIPKVKNTFYALTDVFLIYLERADYEEEINVQIH